MTPRASQWRLGYRPSLDALRGVAVLLVLAGHFGVPGFVEAGFVGVTLFFTLSGYLITGLLLERPDLRRFYIRRARRLLPALAILLVGVGAAELVTGGFDAWWPGALSVVLYVANWAHIAGVPMQGLAHTWSLSVEEQFYLAWPVALLVLIRRPKLGLAIVVGLIVMSFVLTGTDLLALYGTQARAKDLLLGAFLAMIAHYRGRDVQVPTWAAAAAVLALLPIGAILAFPLSPILVSIPCAVIVGWIATRPSLSWRPLRFTGRISYGLYLFHLPLMLALPDGPWRIPMLFVASYAVATLSWFLIERRILGRSPSQPQREAERAVAGPGALRVDAARA